MLTVVHIGTGAERAVERSGDALADEQLAPLALARNEFCAAAVDQRQLLRDGVELRAQSFAVLEMAECAVVDPIGQDLYQSSLRESICADLPRCLS